MAFKQNGEMIGEHITNINFVGLVKKQWNLTKKIM